VNIWAGGGTENTETLCGAKATEEPVVYKGTSKYVRSERARRQELTKTDQRLCASSEEETWRTIPTRQHLKVTTAYADVSARFYGNLMGFGTSLRHLVVISLSYTADVSFQIGKVQTHC
jgi:hypothetical protein